MADFPFDAVVFDLDGTLVDSAPDLAASLNHTLAQLGRPGIEAEKVRHLVGHGAKALLRKGLAASGDAPEELVEQGYPLYIDHYAAHICVGAKKPDPRPLREAIARSGGGRAVLVGDSITDADTAQAAGVPFVAVSFGFSDRPVEALGADAVIDGYSELIGALERL